VIEPAASTPPRHDHRRRLIQWGGTALVMFAAAAILTSWVTSVDGRLPTFSHYQRYPNKVQIISIYARPDGPGISGSKGLRYFDDGLGSNRPTFEAILDPNADVVFFLNNLVDGETGCTQGPESKREKLAALKVADRLGQISGTLWRLAAHATDTESLLQCRLDPASETHTFTRKMMSVWFPLVDATVTSLDPQLSGKTAVGKTLLTFASDGADLFTFTTVYGTPEAGFGSSTRPYTAGSSFIVTWNNVRDEQLRDLLLVLIGTAIALFVHALIETIKVWHEPPPAGPPALEAPAAAANPAAIEPGAADGELP
jgi:hypothetical protein